MMMVQMIPNAALIQGTVTAVENYAAQEGFYLTTLLINDAGEKEGVKFLGDELKGNEAKILISGDLKKKLQLQPAISITGEIKKVSPFLWKAVEDTWQLAEPVKRSTKRSLKK
jgi:hypothetical protein